MSQSRFDSPEMVREVRYRPHESLLPIVDWHTPTISEMPDWSAAKRVSIDLECKDPQLRKLGPGCRRRGNHVVGIGFAIEDGPEFYLPMRHEGGDNVEFDAWGYIQEQLRNFKGTIVGNGLPYDIDWLCQPNGDGAPNLDVNHPIFSKKIG